MAKSALKLFIKKQDLLKKVKQYFQEAKQDKERAYSLVDIADNKTESTGHQQSLLVVFKNWYDGDQWNIDPLTGKKISKNNKIAYPVINYTKTIINHEVGLFKKTNPSFYTTPVEDSDIKSAEAVDSLLRYFWKKRKIGEKVALAYKDSKIYGTAFLKVIWNSFIDDIDVVPINPVNVFPDKFGTSIDEMRFIHIVYIKPAEYLKAKYGKKYDKDVVLKETWINKGVIGEDGYCVVWTDKEILDIKPLSGLTEGSKIPIIAIRNDPSTDRFWGSSQVRELAALQILHNKTLGLILDALLINNSGRLITTDETLKVTNNPLDIIHYQNGEQVTVLPPIPVNNGLYDILNFTSYPMAQQLSDVFSVDTMARHRTASGIAALESESNTKVESDIREISSVMSKLGMFLVDFALKLYTTKDLKRILGNTDVKIKNIKHYDIQINMSSDLPTDRISKINTLMQMAQMHIIQPSTVLSVLNIPELNEAAKQEGAANNKMQDIMQALQSGGAPTEAPTDIPQEGGEH